MSESQKQEAAPATPKKKTTVKNRTGVNKKTKTYNKKPRITDTERLKVLQMLAEGITVTKIAEDLDRSFASIASIAEKLKQVSLQAFNQDVADVAENATIEPEDYIDTQVYKNVLLKLSKAGVDKSVAEKRIRKICDNAKKNGVENISEENLFNAAMVGSELIKNSSDGGRDGMAIMTQAAAEKGDSIKKKSSNLNQHIDDTRIFKL